MFFQKFILPSLNALKIISLSFCTLFTLLFYVSFMHFLFQLGKYFTLMDTKLPPQFCFCLIVEAGKVSFPNN